MKTRNDFISNSSSCSFIIKPDNKDFITKLCDNLQLKRNEIEYMLKEPLSTLPVLIKADSSITSKLKKLPSAKLLNTDNKNENIILIDFIDLFNEKILTPKITKSIKELELYGYDDTQYDKTPFIHIIYHALNNIGIQVSDKRSERSIQHESGMSSYRLFIHKLCKIAYNRDLVI